MLRSARIVGVTAAAAASLVLSALPATGAEPRAGATYRGSISGAPASQDLVKFHVSDSGNWVRRLRVGPWPLTGHCGSGGTQPPTQSSSPAAIKNGQFTAQVVYRNDAGAVVVRSKVTGTFLRRGREAGTVTSDIVGSSCSESLPYTTHVVS